MYYTPTSITLSLSISMLFLLVNMWRRQEDRDFTHNWILGIGTGVLLGWIALSSSAFGTLPKDAVFVVITLFVVSRLSDSVMQFVYKLGSKFMLNMLLLEETLMAFFAVNWILASSN